MRMPAGRQPLLEGSPNSRSITAAHRARPHISMSSNTAAGTSWRSWRSPTHHGRGIILSNTSYPRALSWPCPMPLPPRGTFVTLSRSWPACKQPPHSKERLGPHTTDIISARKPRAHRRKPADVPPSRGHSRLPSRGRSASNIFRRDYKKELAKRLHLICVIRDSGSGMAVRKVRFNIR